MSVSTVLAEAQSEPAPSRVQTHSITRTTRGGGEVKPLTSVISFLDKLSKAANASIKAGFAFANSSSASSVNAWASACCSLMIIAS